MRSRFASNARLLFICKKRETHHHHYSETMSSGLRLSAQLVVDMLIGEGIAAKLAEITDNNDIDREVAAFKPTHAIIEAFWVVPDKFDVLARLHPTVSWIIRAHSELPFLAAEGIAVEWIIAYAGKPNVVIASNTPQATADILTILNAAYPAMPDATLSARLLYLPNFYPEPVPSARPHCAGPVVHVGCFGAVRPLKNQLAQAVAALRFAEQIRRPVHFHINATRVEGQGEPALRNLRSLFVRTPFAKLVEHEWLPHDQFLAVMRGMDLSLQVSLSETFNIVTADAVAVGVPVVASEEIYWLDRTFWADPNHTDSILSGMLSAWRGGQGRLAHQARLLTAYAARARAQWLGLLQ